MRPKGSAQALEARRRIAVGMLQQGKSPTEVARLVGVSRQAVSQWKTAFQQGGPEALAAKPPPGNQRKLQPEQLQALEQILLEGPLAAGYSTDLWTLARVAEVIEAHFGVSYCESGVWRLLRRLGWSCQKPERRARERNDQAVQRWRQKDWPRIKKSAS